METLNLFGSSHTVQKLTAVKNYLNAYQQVFKKQENIETIYVDVFSGCGYYNPNKPATSKSPDNLSLFQDELVDSQIDFRKGSAVQALEIKPMFDKYIFMEKDSYYNEELNKLKAKYETQNSYVQLWPGDANERLRDWVATFNSKKQRAVCFIDPYGMKMEWRTLEALSKKQGIDIWYLMPGPEIISRVIPTHKSTYEKLKNKDSVTQRLNIFYGTEDWAQYAYRKIEEQDLFGTFLRDQDRDVELMENFIVERLESIFAYVHAKPIKLIDPRKNKQIFSLFFMMTSHNHNAQNVAKRIASHIIDHSKLE